MLFIYFFISEKSVSCFVFLKKSWQSPSCALSLVPLVPIYIICHTIKVPFSESNRVFTGKPQRKHVCSEHQTGGWWGGVEGVVAAWLFSALQLLRGLQDTNRGIFKTSWRPPSHGVPQMFQHSVQTGKLARGMFCGSQAIFSPVIVFINNENLNVFMKARHLK